MDGVERMPAKRHKDLADRSQREKMVAIGTMAAGIAHEIGNPLACLSALVQLMQRHDCTEQQVECLLSMQEQIDRIARTVRQMLEFSRPAPSQWVLSDVDELIEQTVKMVRYSHCVRRRRMQSVRNGNLPKVRIIPQQFEQVLVNLLLNAVDAMDGVSPDEAVIIERTVEGGWVNILVKDSGCGMTEEQVDQAFEPFYTTKTPGRGTGLGLAVSYRLVKHQKGRIKIDSSPGLGTVVTVSFRIPEAQSETADSAR